MTIKVYRVPKNLKYTARKNAVLSLVLLKLKEILIWEN